MAALYLLTAMLGVYNVYNYLIKLKLYKSPLLVLIYAFCESICCI